MIVPPALLSGGHAEQLEQTSKDFPCLLLEMANMRVPRHRKYDRQSEHISLSPEATVAWGRLPFASNTFKQFHRRRSITEIKEPLTLGGRNDGD
jgi:hypothetical protein